MSDEPSPPPDSPLRSFLQGFLVAVAFLTVIPIRFAPMPSHAAIARSRFWYPVVALLLGAILGGAAALAALLGSPPVAAFLVLLLWVGLTGALHLDGFCDLCDGLFGGHTPEQRLAILKDPHLGTFGLAGGVLLLLGKFAALQQALGQPGHPAWLVAAAVAWSRCLALCLAAGARYPRNDGTGKILIEATGWTEAATLALLMLVLLMATAPSPWTGLGAAALVGLLAMALRWACVRRLGGVTGDCLGAEIESAETAFLLIGVMVYGGGTRSEFIYQFIGQLS